MLLSSKMLEFNHVNQHLCGKPQTEHKHGYRFLAHLLMNNAFNVHH